MADCVNQASPVMPISEILAALAKFGIQLPVQTHADDSCTIADADGQEICVIDPNSRRDDADAFEIAELLIQLINAVVTPVAKKALDATDIASEAADIAYEVGALLSGRNTAACYLALSMTLGAAAATAERPDFDGMINFVEAGARKSFEHLLKEHGRG